MKTGIELIAQERKEQIEKHGRNIQEDVEFNCDGELAQAATALLDTEDEKRFRQMPEMWDDDQCVRMTGKPYKERLIIAGALIAAEIDRLQAIETDKSI
jgi:hypothetical protein